MNQYPFVKCLHPVRHVNKYTGEPMLLPCCKCIACLKQKTALSALKCQLESMSHKYTHFVTLTFNNRNIPLASIHEDSILVCRTRRLMNWYNIVADISCTKDEFKLFYDKVQVGRMIPFLSKRDIQLFIKRLRKYVTDYFKKKYKVKDLPPHFTRIRYYAVGEYGPTTYRPHYHLLLWYDNDEIFEIMEQALCSCWTFGIIDSSLSEGGAAQYTSGYVNSYCNLPSILKTSETRPFCVHSQFLGEAVLQMEKEAIYSNDFRGFSKRSINIDGVNTEFNLWRSFKTYFFPRCRNYDYLTEQQRLFSYTIYETASRWAKETSTIVIARKIVDRIINPPLFPDYEDYRVSKMLDYFTKLRMPDTKYEDIKFFDNINNDFYERKKEDTCQRLSFIRKVYMDLRLSSHFMFFVCDSRNDYLPKLRKIQDFYVWNDYENLRNFMVQQQIFYDTYTSDCDCQQWFYSDVSESYDIKLTSFEDSKFREHLSFRTFKTDRELKFNKSIKHRELNDANKIFNSF